MSFKPRRMISFKHEPLKNGNIIGDDIERSDIENQEELEAEQDEFKQLLFSKRASRPDHATIRCLYAPSLIPTPEENILLMDSAADQSVIGQGFKIMFYTGQPIKMDGALVGMEGGQDPIMCAAAVVEDKTSDPLIIVVVN